MSSVAHAKLILEVLHDERISNLSDETDERQLEIYSLAIFKVRDTVEKYQPIEIPFETIFDGLEVLNEISISLVPISLREAGDLYRIKEDILPLVEDALTSASQVVKIYERERKKTKKGVIQKEDLPQEYDHHVIRFRRLVIEIHEHLREE